MNLIESGRFLMLAGAMLIVIGLFFSLHDKIPLGRLPGDLHFVTSRFKINIPIGTSILISIALTIIFNFFTRK